MKKALLPALVALAMAAPAAQADGVAVEPGLWEMTTTMTMPMLPQPQTFTTSECVEDAVLDVADMGGEDPHPECVFDVSQPDANTVKWSAQCPVEGGGTSRAEWQATSHGDSVEGEGNVTMTMMGQEFSMDATFSGRRVGDCPAD
jgi:hypothetical protein